VTALPSAKQVEPAGRHWVDAFDGDRLAAHRRTLGWSQVRLAERLQQARAGDDTVPAAEVARQIRTLVVQVSCYESGRTRPRGKAIRALAAVLDVDVLDLLTEGSPLTLATLRARLGLTQGDVADQLGMSRTFYAAVEQGRRAASDSEITAVAAVLQVPAGRIRAALAGAESR
jgi:transcriptional regulator with XRE-family HTH domain